MLAFIFRRLLGLIFVIWVIITVTFVLLDSVEGGPFDSERRALPEAVMKNLRARYELDAPLWTRYWSYVSRAARGDLGPSLTQDDKSVNAIIAENAGKSALLGLISVLISIGFGAPIGVLAARYQNRMIDHASMFMAIVFVSAPNFVIAALLIHLFVQRWKIAPLGWEGPASLILPSLALSAFSLAYITRMTRASMLETMRSDYVRTARAKGLSEGRALVVHAFRNAMLPVVTYMGPMIAAVATGSLVIEEFFGIPGLGRYFVRSVLGRDYFVVLGLAIFYTTILVALNTLVDIIYAWLDPRIQVE